MERFRHCLRTDGGHHLFDGGERVKALAPQIEPAGLDAAQVEDIVDQRQQVQRIAVNVANEPLLLLVQGPHHLLQQQLSEANDGVQRRSQFVAHAGDELGLQAIGAFNFAIAHFELSVCGRQLAGEPLVDLAELKLRNSLRSVTSRITAVTRISPSYDIGLRLISTGVRVPSFRCTCSSKPLPIGRSTGFAQ